MMLPLLHRGMVVAGVPYQKALNATNSGGTPYRAATLVTLSPRRRSRSAKLKAEEWLNWPLNYQLK